MAELFMITEHSPFMMSFVFRTDGGRCVVVDGGRPEDMGELCALIGDRPVGAWILTHPHLDHITGFSHLVAAGTLPPTEKVYFDFPSVAFVERCGEDEDPAAIREFEQLRPRFADFSVRPVPGMTVTVDELTVEFLYIGGEKHFAPRPNLAVNESSLAFRVTSPGARSVLFLGDLGPEGGNDLLALCRDRLASDVVQMAHHGHSGVTKEVYAAISPCACLWCAPSWLWEEADTEIEPGLFGTRTTRRWMAELGVTEHYVTKDGTQKIPLQR